MHRKCTINAFYYGWLLFSRMLNEHLPLETAIECSSILIHFLLKIMYREAGSVIGICWFCREGSRTVFGGKGSVNGMAVQGTDILRMTEMRKELGIA